ncbi:hypothetical protein A2819_00755 [Candidatus Azambacteria bacterium RIFCSPHIGHO2_01_FULL_40_24]|uniref:Glycosyltransferase 2-like domain-containing protein n=1 Tax=Candidatus Azambacteria bacterium RIFCSPHIGHO2_01_FULL_40_24 TaxID=1797301 RepID=A0A1F5B2B9_9BACT|nr:MAG: hypothetical protein A2819_00755 [Candidatus Azambacteria bacterium RIFCSPHIGHO2_01_FULL_40_24]
MSTVIPKYSIIIPTYNRAKFLPKTLDSVVSQTLSCHKYEILIIDDGSTDNTREKVAEFMKQYSDYDIKYFYQKNAGPAKARNLGIKESKGEIIFFTDDDCIVPHNWMATLLDGYRRYPDVVGVGGWYKSSNDSLKKKYFQKYIDFIINKNSEMFEVENKTNIFGYNSAGNTANMSYKKEILEEVGGFDENLYFPGLVDWELKKNIQRWGCYLLYIPLMVNHLKIFNFINFFKKSFNQGRGRYYMFLKYPGLSLSYNINFFNFLKHLTLYMLVDTKFFSAYFIDTLGSFLGRCYVKYIKPFKNIKSAKELKKLNTEIFSVEKRNIKNNTVFTTRFSKFNQGEILPPKIDPCFFSIIIPTYNRSRGLINALNHLIKQTVLKNSYEILIIDDGSTDNTREKVAEFMKQYSDYDIKYFYQKNAGPAKARNLGIKESKGEIIFFTDDDCIVPHNWMATLLDGYRRYPDVVGVGGWHIPPDGELEKSATSRYIHYVSFYSNSIFKQYLVLFEIFTNDPIMFFGTFAYNTANVCYKKEILEKIKGFREDFYWPGSEDNDLGFRVALAGFPILYIPFHVIHSKAMSFQDFYRMYFHRGANGYLLSTIYLELLEKMKPGFVKDYGSIASFISRFNGPEKFLAILEWLSINAGIRYMKNKLAKD